MTSEPLSAEDIRHLRWLRDRFVAVYEESPNFDWMLRFADIIDRLDATRAQGRAEALDVPEDAKVNTDPDSPMAWALRVGAGAFTVKDDAGNICTMALGDINSVARRVQAHLDRRAAIKENQP